MKSRDLLVRMILRIVAVAAAAAALVYCWRWSSTKQVGAVPPLAAAGLDPIGTFLPTVPNPASPPSQAPDGMVWIPGVSFPWARRIPLT